jgi:hypothetical protein
VTNPRILCFVGWTLAFFVHCFAAEASARIEAIKGKRYELTKQHGPWMIMVASLHSLAGKSPTAEEAADGLVYELRRKGIPAYVFRQDQVLDKVNTYDRYGRLQERAYTARDDRVCIIAGNYPSIEDRVAQKTLEYIKTLSPKCWEEHGIYRKSPGRPGPLSGAFLTINPLLSPEEVAKKSQDPLVARLNASSEYSLIRNPAKFTLVVATFEGRSTTKIGTRHVEEAERSFQVGDGLDDAAEDAETLASLLRSRQSSQTSFAPLLDGLSLDAYVFHDRYRSLVTVGGFDTPQDPRLPELARRFGAKTVRNPATGQTVLTGETILLPNHKSSEPAVKTFLFDWYPRLMEVPKLQ